MITVKFDGGDWERNLKKEIQELAEKTALESSREILKRHGMQDVKVSLKKIGSKQELHFEHADQDRAQKAADLVSQELS